MTEQEIKLELVRIFGNSLDSCEKAYDFILKNAVSSSEVTSASKIESGGVIAVDLGLPSGTLWGDRNLGAGRREGYGDYFSWGNVVGHRPPGIKNDWGENTDVFIYEYTEKRYNQTIGSQLTTDIDVMNDAATFYLGAPWRMPSKEDFQELFEHCDYTRVTRNGVNGLLLASKNNGNTIFFPAAGSGANMSISFLGSRGGYWSSSLCSSDYGCCIYFNSFSVNFQDNRLRSFGYPIRPIYPKL